MFFFFFQAEDGIRDVAVTGVQPCALPICSPGCSRRRSGLGRVYKRDPAMSDADCNLDYLMGEQIIAGSPDEVLRRLLLLIEETGPFGTLVLMGYDWDDKQSWLHSMELFARELMPALNKAVGSRQ